MKNSPPVLIAGMHRSGSSLVASWLASMGLDVGADQVPAHARDRRGTFEDQRFLELNRRLLVACCAPDDGGRPDWGWTEGESFDTSRGGGAHLAEFMDDARRLLERIGPRSRAWGFQDPCATPLLDAWLELLGDARFVLVYRDPWDVADSIQRLGSEIFLARTDYAPRIWSYYNRLVLDFYRRHPDRSLLVSTRGVLEKPEVFVELLTSKLGLQLGEARLEDVYASRRFTNRPPGDPLPPLFTAAHPETLDVLGELEETADLPPERRRAPDAGAALQPCRFEPSPELPEPPVAVVIPCRDQGELLVEAIASVERTVPEPYELIVVDDGSSEPRTVEIMGRLERAGYRIERQPPLGVCAARNRGFSLVRAPYVIPLDADNRLRPGPFLEAAIAELEADAQLGAVYGDRHEFGLREGRRTSGDFDLTRLLKGNYIDTCAVMRWATWADIGGYDEQLLTWEDWELWIRVAHRGWGLRHLEQVAFDYRVRPRSLVSATEDPEIREAILGRVITRHREVFEPFFVEQLGYNLAAWPFHLLEYREARRGEPSAAAAPERGGERHDPRPLADEGLELARARLAAVQAARQADSAAWRLAAATSSARHFEESAQQLLHTLDARNEVVSLQQALLETQRHRLEELSGRLERSDAALRRIEAESVEREDKLRQLGLDYDATMAESARLRRELERLHAERLEAERLEAERLEAESALAPVPLEPQAALWRRVARRARRWWRRRSGPPSDPRHHHSGAISSDDYSSDDRSSGDHSEFSPDPNLLAKIRSPSSLRAKS